MTAWIDRLKRLLTSEKDDVTLTNPPLNDQLARLEQQSSTSLAALIEKLDGFEKYLARLSKEQFKANALTENALAEIKSVTAPRTSGSERISQMKPPPQSNTRLLEALMPILDSIEAGLASGQAQCSQITDERARETLTAWLEGQRLLRDRLLALFDKENVRPIDSIGQGFDPYRHVAVQTVYDPGRPTGTIIEVQRPGYETDQRVLRFADVIVTTNRQS